MALFVRKIVFLGEISGSEITKSKLRPLKNFERHGQIIFGKICQFTVLQHGPFLRMYLRDLTDQVTFCSQVK